MSDGVLLVAHGTVESLDDLPAFVQRIRRGRPAPAGLVEELRRRYEIIGGSPLLATTKEQARHLARLLDLPVLVGMRLWHPEVSEALAGAADLGVRRLCVLPMAPYSVHIYCAHVRAELERLKETLGPRAPELLDASPWGTLPGFLDAYLEQIRVALDGSDGYEVILTAHSLPSHIIREGDPYRVQFEAAVVALRQRLGIGATLAYQSQGADGGDWLGPSLLDAMQAARARGCKGVVVAPLGFVAEHVETLYDLDVEAKAQAAELGLGFRRVPVIELDDGMMRALAGVARDALRS
ncbi:MAG: ferrochelatase [Polyangiaceae bacterium]